MIEQKLMKEKEDIVILIPAYNPDDKMYELIQKLHQNQFCKIVVVDDGSSKKESFQKIENQVVLLKHKENQGKGMALKTGMNYCAKKYRDITGVITVDADGQHKVEDVCKVYEVFKKDTASIVLGSRDFKQKGIPIKSKIGNIAFANLLRCKTKVKVTDTQTGLRAIPLNQLEKFITIKGERFEYETNMLLYCMKNDIKIQEVPIQNVYENKNKASNYRPIKDSIKILRQFLLDSLHKKW